jgi:hypothetical protein
MIDHGDDVKGEAGPGSRPWTRAAIPGDPFPWEPEHPAESSTTPTGAIPTPADSADPASFDLGGGD